MEYIGVSGIFISLLILVFLAFRGVNLIIVAPLTALLAVLLDGDTRFMAAYTQVYMTGLGGFLITYFPLFLLGAIFGRLIADSGSSKTIAAFIMGKMGKDRAIFAVVLACALLTYGGVSLFVVAFAVYPIAAAAFREADIPKRLIPASIALGSFTFTMTALPGTPQIQNVIPTTFFKTSIMAAPMLGIIAGGIMWMGGLLWLDRRTKQARLAGEGYGHHPGRREFDRYEATQPATSAKPVEAVKPKRRKKAKKAAKPRNALSLPATSPMPAGPQSMPVLPGLAALQEKLPSIWIALIPVVAVIVLNRLYTIYLNKIYILPYLSSEQFGSTTIASVRGNWAVIGAVFTAVVIMLVVKRRYLIDLKKTLNVGATDSLQPIFNTAAVVGYGKVIKLLSAFTIIKESVTGIFPSNPLVSESASISVMTGITGSAAGGLSIAMETLGGSYLQMAQQVGINPELMHRVASIASGSMHALPHNGAIITLLAVCGLTHKDSYIDIAVISVVIPLIALAAVVCLGTAFGSF